MALPFFSPLQMRTALTVQTLNSTQRPAASWPAAVSDQSTRTATPASPRAYAVVTNLVQMLSFVQHVLMRDRKKFHTLSLWPVCLHYSHKAPLTSLIHILFMHRIIELWFSHYSHCLCRDDARTDAPNSIYHAAPWWLCLIYLFQRLVTVQNVQFMWRWEHS